MCTAGCLEWRSWKYLVITRSETQLKNESCDKLKDNGLRSKWDSVWALGESDEAIRSDRGAERTRVPTEGQQRTAVKKRIHKSRA